MGVIMIRCPHTGLAVSTGIETDDETFDALPDSLGFGRLPEMRPETYVVEARGLAAFQSRRSRVLSPNNRSLSCRPRSKTRTTGIGE